MDALPLTINDKDALDKVPEQLRGLYAEKDGKYVLAVAPRTEVDATAAARKKAEDEAAAIRSQFAGITAEEARAAIELKRKLEEKKLMEKGDIDALLTKRVDGVRAELGEKLSAAEKRAMEAEQRLARELRDSQIRAAAAKAGVLPAALEDVERAGREVFEVRGGELIAKTPHGERKDLTPEAWLASLLTEKKHWLAASSGAGTPPTGNAPGGIARSKMSVAEKAAFVRAHGAEAFARLPL